MLAEGALGPDQRERIERLSRQFAILLARGESPRIEEFVADWSEPGRGALLSGLISLELHHLQSPPSLNEYELRFPQDASRIAEAYRVCVHENHPTEQLSDTIIAEFPPSDEVDPPGRNCDPPACIGEYVLLQQLGRGGMGVVFKAFQPSLGRIVALKVIRSAELADSHDVERFRNEARSAAALDHPGIVPLFGLHESSGQLFITMAHIDGKSLHHYIRTDPLSPREAARILRSIAHAVQYAHERQIVHRDLKPANILMGKDGEPRITDFGLSMRIGSNSGLTASGDILGTPSYMAPEQALGRRDIGPAADVYALGAVLYHLVTGRPPFKAASRPETLSQVISEEPVPARRLNSSVPKDLDTICLKCLQKEPTARYSSALELAQDLDRFLRGDAICARSLGSLAECLRWCRHPHRVYEAGVVMVLTGLFLILLESWGLIRTAFYDEVLRAELPNPRLARIWMAAFLCLGLCMVKNGYFTMRSKPVAVYTGFVCSTALLTWTLGVVAGVFPFEMGGVLSDPRRRAYMFAVFSVLLFALAFYSACAVAAIRYNSILRERLTPRVLK